jgi:hypothetical protein
MWKIILIDVLLALGELLLCFTRQGIFFKKGEKNLVGADLIHLGKYFPLVAPFPHHNPSS